MNPGHTLSSYLIKIHNVSKLFNAAVSLYKNAIPMMVDEEMAVS
jgi:hypothetical protein